MNIQNSHELLEKIKIIFFDFDGVFTDNYVYVDSNGTETVKCSRFDGFGLSALGDIGIHKFILSTECNNVVAKRAEKLKIKYFKCTDNKLEVIKKVCKDKDIQLINVAFVGNDINDLEALLEVGVPIIVEDAYFPLKKYNFIITNLKGGHGAVREVCENIIRSKMRGE